MLWNLELLSPPISLLYSYISFVLVWMKQEYLYLVSMILFFLLSYSLLLSTSPWYISYACRQWSPSLEGLSPISGCVCLSMSIFPYFPAFNSDSISCTRSSVYWLSLIDTKSHRNAKLSMARDYGIFMIQLTPFYDHRTPEDHLNMIFNPHDMLMIYSRS